MAKRLEKPVRVIQVHGSKKLFEGLCTCGSWHAAAFAVGEFRVVPNAQAGRKNARE